MKLNPFADLFKPRRARRTDFKQKLRDTFSVFWGEDAINVDYRRIDWFERLLDVVSSSESFLKAKLGVLDYAFLGLSIPRYILFGITALCVSGGTFLLSYIYHFNWRELFRHTINWIVVFVYVLGIGQYLYSLIYPFFIAAAIAAAIAVVPLAAALLLLVSGGFLSCLGLVGVVITLGIALPAYGARMVISSVLTAVASPIVAFVDWLYSGVERDKYRELSKEFHNNQVYEMDICSLDPASSAQKLMIKFNTHADSMATIKIQKADCLFEDPSGFKNHPYFSRDEQKTAKYLGAPHVKELLDFNFCGLNDLFEEARLAPHYPRDHFFSVAKTLDNGVFQMQSGLGYEKGNLNAMIADYAFEPKG